MKTEKKIGEAPARFSYYEQAGDVHLLSDGRYSFLFVLEGHIECSTACCHTERFEPRTLAVIDKQKLSQCTCTGNTVLLEFLPPKRIEHFFRSASSVFGTSTSEHIPFTDEIDEWIEQLRNDCLLGIRPDEYHYCCRLRSLLRQCPDIVLGTLVIPLHACALTSNKCAQCRTKSEDTHVLSADF